MCFKMFSRKKKNKTQTSTSTTTVTKYEIKDGKASFTKSTKTTENGKVVQKSTTSGDVPLRNLKDAVPTFTPTTYVSPYRSASNSSFTTRLPSTTRIWDLPKTQLSPRWEPSSASSLIKRWEASPTISNTRPPTNIRPITTTTTQVTVTPKITIAQPSRPIPAKSKLRAGNVYILNHMIFNNSKNEYRVGSDKDVDELMKTFKKFNMKVTVKSDQTKRDIKLLMDKVQRENFANHACIVFVILTHGTRYEMISAKDELYSIDDDVLFPMVRNDTLRGKPKIILVQACKGDKEIEIFADSIKSSPGGNPDEILKFYSTFEGFLSYRTELGSYFIQSFCSHLQKNGHTSDISEICEQVIKDVKVKSKNKQIPTMTKNLTEKFVFGDYK